MAFGSNPFGSEYFGQSEDAGGVSSSISVPFIASTTQVFAPTLLGAVRVSQVAVEVVEASSTAKARVSQLAVETLRTYTGAAVNAGVSQVAVEVLRSVTPSEVDVPFISSTTSVYGVMSLFIDIVRTGPGNGGESFPVRLAANGVSFTATLSANLSTTDTSLSLSGDGSFPTTQSFVVTIDSEVIYVTPLGSGLYRIRHRALSNTTLASHSSGATVTWGDTYDMAIVSTNDIGSSFTADINSTGSTTYQGWLICFDSTQALSGSSRFPMHVTEVVGVFPAGTGTSGTNALDASQPNAICTTATVSDNCPAALANPALISASVAIGDVAIVSYTNPEATVLDLVSRSTALQSWYGMKRVDDTDHDVTLTDPTGHVVDTIPTSGPYTGSVNGVWLNPSSVGISPSTGNPTTTAVPYTSVTLPGTDRYFTYGSPHYSEKGWPICCLAVRQNSRRVPLWQSWDWHNYNYIYSGFYDEATFAQILINRNGIVFDSVPEVELPGSQDIDGPDAVWDDGSYYFAASWYVALFSTPYLVVGPAIGGSSTISGSATGYAPVATFTTGGALLNISIPTVEGGQGGDINPPPGNSLFYVTLV